MLFKRPAIEASFALLNIHKQKYYNLIQPQILLAENQYRLSCIVEGTGLIRSSSIDFPVSGVPPRSS
jgi:hypothetical protein